MLYRKLGNTGLDVSALGFGAMRLPHAGGAVDRGESLRLMHAAFELGVNYIDTAHTYLDGQSEALVGEAIRDRRDRVLLATKNMYRAENGREWTGRLEEQLARLKTDCIDFYHIHCLYHEQLVGPMSAPGGPLDEADRALRAGKIRYLSVSTHDAPDKAVQILESGLFTLFTVQYNLIDRSYLPAIRKASEMGIAVVVMGPAGGGRLVRHTDATRALVAGAPYPAAELALRFVLDSKDVNTAISGMSRIEELIRNVKVARLEETLTDDERRSIEAGLARLEGEAEHFCTRCEYCKPCPNGLDISVNLGLHGLWNLWGMEKEALEIYRFMGENPEFGKHAAECIQCGECEPKCPQNIPIVDMLRVVQGLMEGKAGGK